MTSKIARTSLLSAIALAALVFSPNIASARSPVPAVSDAALVRSLPGFKNAYATANGIRLHYVVGGQGAPLLLLPGWPETWWEYHKMMPTLAAHFRVVAVDLRGMGASERPATGYDKKTMAKDIFELVQKLSYEKVYIAGHDIGSLVAYSFAANYPQAALKVALLDVAPFDKSFMSTPLLPGVGTFGDKIDPNHPYPWWFAFHQVKGLPERMLAGRINLELDWFFKYVTVNEAAIEPRDRAVYIAAYNSADAIRAGDAWYQAFPQDIVDDDTYGKLEMPVLALGGPGYGWLSLAMPGKATNVQVVHIENCGHFIPEEQPDVASRWFIKFFQ